MKKHSVKKLAAAQKKGKQERGERRERRAHTHTHTHTYAAAHNIKEKADSNP